MQLVPLCVLGAALRVSPSFVATGAKPTFEVQAAPAGPGTILAEPEHLPKLQAEGGVAEQSTVHAGVTDAPEVKEAEAPEEKEPEEGEGEGAGHPAVPMLLYAAVFLGPVLVEFACSGGLRQQLTLRLVEAFITIFVALHWFQAFDKLLRFHDFEAHHMLLAAFLHLIFLFILATMMSWTMRSARMRLATFTACAAHYVAFAGMHTAGHLQMAHFDSFAMTPLFLLCVICGVVAILSGMYYLRKALRYYRNDKYEESINDLENDVCALTLGYCLAHTAKYVLSGEVRHFQSHAVQGDFLQRGEPAVQVAPDHIEEAGHTGGQRFAMFVLAFACLGLSMTVASGDHLRGLVRRKFLDVTKLALVMAGALTLLLALKWEFVENVFPSGVPEDKAPLAASAFALVVTSIAFVVIGCMSAANVDPDSKLAQSFPLAIGLSAGFAWEQAFDAALEAMVASYEVVEGDDGLFLKMAFAVVAPVCLLPMYVRHVKPRLMPDDISADG